MTGTQIIPAELFGQLDMAVNNARATPDLRF